MINVRQLAALISKHPNIPCERYLYITNSRRRGLLCLRCKHSLKDVLFALTFKANNAFIREKSSSRGDSRLIGLDLH